VFLIYLYQRWLYPVDQTRIDCSGMIEETCQGENTEQKVTPAEKNTEHKGTTTEKSTEQKNDDKLVKKAKPNKKKD
jgi:hypothetical protein